MASSARALPCAAASSISRRSRPAAADPFEPRLVGQDRQHLVERLARLAQDDRQREDVEVADAVVVGQARLRAHAQAARDRLAVADRTQR